MQKIARDIIIISILFHLFLQRYHIILRFYLTASFMFQFKNVVAFIVQCYINLTINNNFLCQIFIIEANKRKLKFVLFKTRQKIQQLLENNKLTKLNDDRFKNIIFVHNFKDAAFDVFATNENDVEF